MPLLPHAGATRGTLARYAHGNELLRRSAYAATGAALNFCGFLLVLRTLIRKKADSVSVFSVFFGLFRSRTALALDERYSPYFDSRFCFFRV